MEKTDTSMRFGVQVQKDTVTAALGCLQILQQTKLSMFNIIKDKKRIEIDCASITRAGENRSRWREAPWSSDKGGSIKV